MVGLAQSVLAGKSPKQQRRIVKRQARLSSGLLLWLQQVLGRSLSVHDLMEQPEKIARDLLNVREFLAPSIEVACPCKQLWPLAPRERSFYEFSAVHPSNVDQYLVLTSRSERHATKHLPQEIALVEHLELLCRSTSEKPFRPQCVVDIGGGNGLLAYTLSRKMFCDAVVVDRYLPKLRVDDRECASYPYFRRVQADVGGFNWLADVRTSPDKTLVVCKHLCGSGIDLALRNMWSQGVAPRGMLLSTCCHFKCSLPAYINQPYLRSIGLTDENSWNAVARKTSWLQKERDLWMQVVGEALESILDHGRVLWLRQNGYRCSLVQWIHPTVAWRNKLLFAWKAEGCDNLLR